MDEGAGRTASAAGAADEPDGGSSEAGEAVPDRRRTPAAPPRPSMAPPAWAAWILLVVFPVGHLVTLDVAGAIATGADVAVLLLLAAAGLDRLSRGPRRGEATFRFTVGVVVLALFGGWIALSGLWGFHPEYAVAKGAGTVGLALAAGALAGSGLGWRRSVEAWLLGTALALAFTLVVLLTGPTVVRWRVLYQGGGVVGLPLPRVSGPFLHPNMLGDYLVVSGALLWGIWPSLEDRVRGAAWALAGMVAVGLLLSASSAWVGAGLVLFGVGRWHAGARGEERSLLGAPTLVSLAGFLLASIAMVGLLLPLDLSMAGRSIQTGGIRPAIWGSAFQAFLEAPIRGVGAAPYLAAVVDPLRGGPAALWDAHNSYLSVLGQFGLLGAGLAVVGFTLLVQGGGFRRPRLPGRRATDPEPSPPPPARLRTALVLAGAAVAVHGLFLAGEDLRHVWLLAGVWGAAGGGAILERVRR